ncbi:hypothetical protein HU200_065921 [Digitaria exilis]|uniref:KIB1-4 beta-propeller domain-containing protein n=1 Tax=Digitaria exilis TaxID=1010633 RepID=A0A835DXI9_9POAL|nr:hypothetical protein HU200_065921 [Digitaria exilis]
MLIRSPEKRDWANLYRDAIREIAGKLLAVDVAEYIRLRAVCKPWRISTDAQSWEPRFFPRNWLLLKHDAATANVAAEAPPANPAAAHRFVNVRTGATLRIYLPAFEEYGDYIAEAEGLLLFHNASTDTVRVFNPLTRATAILPGFFAGLPPIVEEEEAVDLTSAGVITAVDGNVPASPTVVLVLALPLTTVILCAKPGDNQWGTVDAGVIEVADNGDVLPPFQGGLSVQGRFYVPTRNGDVLRVELHPKPHLVYVARPPDRRLCRAWAMASYLVPSLKDDDVGADNDGMLLVRFLVGAIDVLGVHLGSGRYTRIPELGNRVIFLPGRTILADKFPSYPPLEVGH